MYAATPQTNAVPEMTTVAQIAIGLDSAFRISPICHRSFRRWQGALRSPIRRCRKAPTSRLQNQVSVVRMNTDFINIPEKDLRGPETESDQFSEEVRRAVEQSSDHPHNERETHRDDAYQTRG